MTNGLGASRPTQQPLPLTGATGLPSPRIGDARLWLPPARQPGTVEPDVVVFTAACPACGEDSEWVEHREDTRLRASVNCPCEPAEQQVA
jgi:hypothetical protein